MTSTEKPPYSHKGGFSFGGLFCRRLRNEKAPALLGSRGDNSRRSLRTTKAPTEIGALSFGTSRGCNYFNAVLIDTNFALSAVPTPLTAVMMAIAIPAAIRPYSIAVAPDSLAMKRLTKFFIEIPFLFHCSRNSLGFHDKDFAAEVLMLRKSIRLMESENYREIFRFSASRTVRASWICFGVTNALPLTFSGLEKLRSPFFLPALAPRVFVGKSPLSQSQ